MASTHLHPEARVGITLEGRPGVVWIGSHPGEAGRYVLECDDATALVALAKLVGVSHEGVVTVGTVARITIDKQQFLENLPSFIAAVAAGWAP